uniref:Uncharacterized protein n=1 Tax=Acrobeloides nanus TaxID=290746 RepID=A0A914DJA2_9BILA
MKIPSEVRRVIWSDSKVVLGWIFSKSQTLKKFVNNRLDEIRVSDCREFRYVPTDQNPADFGSRGATPNELNQSKLWWDGPEWLKSQEKDWPSVLDQQILEETLEEMPEEERETKKVFLTMRKPMENKDQPKIDIDPERFSK